MPPIPTNEELKEISSVKSFGGWQQVYSHARLVALGLLQLHVFTDLLHTLLINKNCKCMLTQVITNFVTFSFSL